MTFLAPSERPSTVLFDVEFWLLSNGTLLVCMRSLMMSCILTILLLHADNVSANGTSHAHNAADPSVAQLMADRSEASADQEEGFENLMVEMMNMRSRLQGMPDDQRRRAAGDFMLHIQNQLGLSDESSDDD